MKFRSAYPPVSFHSSISNQWYVICTSDGDGWVAVDRKYGWNELEKMWNKIQYSKKEKPKPVKDKVEYAVKGSRGNLYKVVNDKGVWTCSCPAHGFGRGRDCKHIKSLKNEKVS